MWTKSLILSSSILPSTLRKNRLFVCMFARYLLTQCLRGELQRQRWEMKLFWGIFFPFFLFEFLSRFLFFSKIFMQKIWKFYLKSFLTLLSGKFRWCVTGFKRNLSCLRGFKHSFKRILAKIVLKSRVNSENFVIENWTYSVEFCWYIRK